jgi:hypothetical protein
MLGAILSSLTNPSTAESAIAIVARPEVLERLRCAAATDGVSVGALVASRFRNLVEHGSEDIWLDLLGTMSRSPQPGAAVIERMLARVFPGPPRACAPRRTL